MERFADPTTHAKSHPPTPTPKLPNPSAPCDTCARVRSSSLSLQQIDVRMIRPIVHALPIRDVLHTTYHMHFHCTPNFNVTTSEYNSTIASSKQKSRSECVSQHALYFVTHFVVLPMPALNVLVALYCLIRWRPQLQRRRSTGTFYTKRSHHDIARSTSSGTWQERNPQIHAILFGEDRCALRHPACRAHSSSVFLSRRLPV